MAGFIRATVAQCDVFMVQTTRHTIDTTGQGDVHDLTSVVSRVLSGSSIKSGLLTVAVVGSTAGITTIEFEPGAVADLNRIWEQLAPRHGDNPHHPPGGEEHGA